MRCAGPGYAAAVPDACSPDASTSGLREALKVIAVCLKEADIAFALGGGYAAWARGGPEPDHDVDFLVAASEVERAEAVLADRGLRVQRSSEDWLFKVFLDEAMVDVIHHLQGQPLSASALRGAQELEVLSVLMPVISATELMKHKLAALNEHECDFARLLPVARALREQLAWDELREGAVDNDFAAAFLMLLQRLGVAPA
ncbi:MAG: hypothetical protein QOI54_1561 [Actinomycetota bacterium]|nr:hypothetical protein [Actinomycetota bacterium]